MVNVQTNTDLQTCQSLQITSIHETDKMSSLQIASITGKRHADVMRDIRNLVQQLENDNERNFALVTYQDGKGEQRPMYVLTKKGCLCLASGYDANLRMKIINRWEELERQKQYGSFQVPQTFADALLLAAEQQKQLELPNRTNCKPNN